MTTKSKSTWTVPAQIVRVVDGDTLDVVLDLGWHLSMRTKIRLPGVNTPELEPKGAAGPGRAAYIFAEHLLYDAMGTSPEGEFSGAYYPVVVTSHSLDKYGRTLGSVHWTDRHGVLHDLASELLSAGHAVEA